MRTLLSIILYGIVTSASSQKKEKFDIATYALPTGWKETTNTADVRGYAATNNKKATYCQVGLYKSVNSTGDAQLDFDREWQDLIAKPYNITVKPEAGLSTSQDGWEAKSGVAPFDFNGGKSMAMLVTMSGYGKRMSIAILTNTEDYRTEVEKFLESVTMMKPEMNSEPLADNNNTSVVGTWGKSGGVTQRSGDPVSYGNAGYSKDQYTFKNGGTYLFVSKTFRASHDKILLVRENGSYEVNGNHITIMPRKSVMESWSKKEGTDMWGKLLKTEDRTLEKVTYQFTRHYFSGLQEWNLVLQADSATDRDGAFGTNTTFRNAWYYGPITANNPVIELPGGEQPVAVESKKVEYAAPATSNGFAFTTTNFDDGWTSNVREDWVEVRKGTTRVLIHHPNKDADAYNSVLSDGLNKAWNILVAPRYNNIMNYELRPITGWQTIEFAEADALEKSTGQHVHIVLFKYDYSNGTGRYMEFITRDKNSFEQEFGPYHASTSGWENLEKMATYNKFAVAASDLTGKWTNDFSGALQYVNAYTGADAAMATHASNEVFDFGPGNTYRWDLGVASGNVGAIKFQSVRSSGTFSLAGNWQVTFSDIEGRPRTFNAYFSSVKGARLLWLDERAFGKME